MYALDIQMMEMREMKGTKGMANLPFLALAFSVHPMTTMMLRKRSIRTHQTLSYHLLSYVGVLRGTMV